MCCAVDHEAELLASSAFSLSCSFSELFVFIYALSDFPTSGESTHSYGNEHSFVISSDHMQLLIDNITSGVVSFQGSYYNACV